MAVEPDSEILRDALLGDAPRKSFNLTLKTGENVVRGEVVGFETSTGKIRSFDPGGAGGVEKFYGIVVEDADATVGDVPVGIFIQGEFKIGGLIFNTSSGIADQAFINSARDLGVILKKAKAA